jgi:hypothetical protein
MNRTISSAAQSIIIVAACAALGFSLALISGAAGASPFLSAIAGSVFGLIGVFVGFFVRSPIRGPERNLGASIVGLRIAILGFMLAIAGWLVSVFLSPSIGHWAVVIGVLICCTGLAILRFGASVKNAP